MGLLLLLLLLRFAPFLFKILNFFFMFLIDGGWFYNMGEMWITMCFFFFLDCLIWVLHYNLVYFFCSFDCYRNLVT